MTRHLFAGANTHVGFLSYYDNILPEKEAAWTVYLKGSSGSGKSSFLKKIAKYHLEKGEDVEFFHCSNDPKSLDGVLLTEKKILIVDGTAPHIGEPKAPGILDEILNFGEYIDYEKAAENKVAVCQLISEKKHAMKKAYGYFAAAYNVYCNNTEINRRFLNESALYAKVADELKILEEFKNVGRCGKDRRMFLSAVTPLGFYSFIGNELEGREVRVLHGNDGTGTEIMLEELRKAANIRGLDTESFYCAVKPEKIEHLFIPEMNMFYTTDNNYHSIHCVGERPSAEIFFEEFLDSSKMANHASEIRYNFDIFDMLMKKTIDYLKLSKDFHDKIESLYVGCMDFHALDILCEQTIKRISRF